MKDLSAEISERLEQEGHKLTRARRFIFEELLKQKRHVSAEEILKLVRKKEPKMGLATVYRTLKIFQDCHLVKVHYFGASEGLFELERGPESHHDHLICEGCHLIVEFSNPQIEALQEGVAEQYGFHLTHHRMELYGLCSDCE